MENIRNFCIIAHIDHGKSTLADRFLEITKTVPARSMRPQYLDQLELERERGITIKMAPVRMIYHADRGFTQTATLTSAENELLYEDTTYKVRGLRESALGQRESAQVEYILNLIDTPGHNDFAYEVSRALMAVEGAILLVDVTQGIQAQTLANFNMAKEAGLTIVGAVNKIDLNPADLPKIMKEMAVLLGTNPGNIHKISGKTGDGVRELLFDVIKRVPPPKKIKEAGPQALIFDSLYDDHKGAVAFVRVFGGGFKDGDETGFLATGVKFKIKELGHFSPRFSPARELESGEIGYIASGIKDPSKLKIGDTIGVHALPGYKEPRPVVFVSLYPAEEAKYDDLKSAMNRLKLNDASFSFEADFSEVLGRGFKCGFLGQLHFEIVTQRLFREFKLETVSSFPSVAYRVIALDKDLGEKEILIKTPQELPAEFVRILQPIVKLEILTPPNYLGDILSLQKQFKMSEVNTRNFGEHLIVSALMPLSELISDFDDKLKSISEGYASFSYEAGGEEEADLVKLEVMVASDTVPGLTRLVFKDEVSREARLMVERLKDLLPKQQFAQAIQAKADGRIIARETIPALKKDVTGYLYGGDRTRKMKLWKKQKKGKKRLKETGRVSISADIFKELLKK